MGPWDPWHCCRIPTIEENWTNPLGNQMYWFPFLQKQTIKHFQHQKHQTFISAVQWVRKLSNFPDLVVPKKTNMFQHWVSSKIKIYLFWRILKILNIHYTRMCNQTLQTSIWAFFVFFVRHLYLMIIIANSGSRILALSSHSVRPSVTIVTS